MKSDIGSRTKYLTRREAAELLGLSRSGVYALLERALRRLASLVCRDEAKKEADK